MPNTSVPPGNVRHIEPVLASDLVRPDGLDPTQVVLIDGQRRITWGELDGAVNRIANALAGLGLNRGDRVALQLATRIEFVQIYFGALRAGLVVVPINTTYTTGELAYVLQDCGARILVTESAAAGALDAAALEHVVFVEDLAQLIAGAASSDPRADSSGESLAVILYTSGTSGHPRGAMLSVRALLGNLEQLAKVEPAPIQSSDVVFLSLPLFHIYGLNAALGAALHAGAQVVLTPRFELAKALELIVSEQVSVVIGAPGMFVQLATGEGFAAAFGSVRLGISGSAPLSPALVETYRSVGVPLYEGYGLTETAPVLTLNLVGSGGVPQPGSVGHPLPGVEVQLHDSAGAVLEPEDEDPGQLYVRGSNLFSGYWPDGREGPDAEGWFATGDLAVRDANGGLRLIGRTSDLIIVNGFNVYPAEVERVLGQVDGVVEVAVTGVPDTRTGEAVAAFVVTAPGSRVTREELLAQAEGSLARFKRPRELWLVGSLPHTVTGKVQKWRLRGDHPSEELP